MLDTSVRVNILGVGVSAVTLDAAVAEIGDAVAARTAAYVCVVPAHSVMDCVRDPLLRPVFNRAMMCTPDGMAIVWLLRMHGHHAVTRVYGPDLMAAVCERSLSTGWRHFFLGGAPGVAEELAERLAARYPGLQFAGHDSPPFRALSDAEDAALVAEVNATRPDIIWVGLGAPKQERWMASHVGRVRAPVMVGVGAAFDFLSGHKAQAPRWVQRGGLEWLYRWAREPRRLFPRYGRYPLFALLVAAQAVGLARFPLDGLSESEAGDT